MLWLNFERTLNNEVGRWELRRDEAKNGHHFEQTAMTKKGRPFFSGKIGVTPSVAAPSDINPSDATV